MSLEPHIKKLIPIAFERFGVMPSAIYEQTPHELADMMFKRVPDAPTPADPVKSLKKINDDRAKKGKGPIVPKLGDTFKRLFPGVRSG